MGIETIDEYIQQFSGETETRLRKIREVIREAVPEAKEKIRYAMPTFTLGGKNLVHFAAFKKHIGFYPTPEGITDFSEELARYKSSKGSAQFPLNEPAPYDLIRRMTLSRAASLRNGKNGAQEKSTPLQHE
ncbi:MAG: DUF1801 domain-containing protein [Spirochaetaceae bacterium]|jgi:uncharacterized protein YdhG (YjbR/CyaY superfamily)|nr:DUF1801 domain-containing protein [Spirochaetaceae bacterium]